MPATTLEPDVVEFVCRLVRERSAIELEASKAYLVEARLNPVARRNGYPSITTMVRMLQSKFQPELQRQVIESLCTCETSFFRDIHPFNALRTSIIPELIKARAGRRTLNIWSAACSTGQEAYSTSMLLREHFPELAAWSVQILGTDLSDDVLEKARSGRYTQMEVNRGLPAAMLVKHLHREGLSWELNPSIRSLVNFHKMNLIEPWPALPLMDVIFLRNVLIYFSVPTKKAILEKIRKVMAPDAVLFLGAAETTLGIDDSFRPVRIDNTTFYRPN